MSVLRLGPTTIIRGPNVQQLNMMGFTRVNAVLVINESPYTLTGIWQGQDFAIDAWTVNQLPHDPGGPSQAQLVLVAGDPTYGDPTIYTTSVTVVLFTDQDRPQGSFPVSLSRQISSQASVSGQVGIDWPINTLIDPRSIRALTSGDVPGRSWTITEILSSLLNFPSNTPIDPRSIRQLTNNDVVFTHKSYDFTNFADPGGGARASAGIGVGANGGVLDYASWSVITTAAAAYAGRARAWANGAVVWEKMVAVQAVASASWIWEETNMGLKGLGNTTLIVDFDTAGGASIFQVVSLGIYSL